jgi:hypothetical protein
MRRILDLFPFFLLLVILPFFFYKDPSIAQSIIAVGLTALCGYQYNILDKKHEFESRLEAAEKKAQIASEEADKRVEKAMVYLEQKITAIENKTNELRTDVSKNNVEKLRTKQTPKFQF